MSKFIIGNIFLAGSITLGAISHVLLKSIVDATQNADTVVGRLQVLWNQGKIPSVLGVGVMLVLAFGCWVACLTKLQMGYAYPMAALTILAVTVLSVLVLGESLTARQVVGVCCMVLGAMLLAPVR